MQDVLDELLRWWRAGDTVGVGTVVGTWKSAPRPPGAAMVVGPDGTAAGSVSGGCVEGAVYDVATEVREGAPPRLHRYGVTDDDAFAVGLTCGGIIDVFVEAISQATFPELDAVAADIREGRPVAVATLVDSGSDSSSDNNGNSGNGNGAGSGNGADSSDGAGGDSGSRDSGGNLTGRRLVVRPDATSGSLGSVRLDEAVRADARGLLEQGRSALLRYGADGERRRDEIGVFVASYAPRPRMIVFGAIDFAAAVARVGSFLGYRVTVCDARPVFATKRRFPDADEVVVEWPHKYLEATETDERTVLCVLTHDPKFDIPLLEIALRRRLAYIGAMGSRRTNDGRLAQLRERGLTEDELALLHAPIGLDTGARTPEETAVSVAAEIIAARWGGSGAPLSRTQGAIHREARQSVS